MKGTGNNLLIDLHVHSSESDGTLSVTELVDHAVAHKVGILALCDHDTTSGLSLFHRYGAEKGITTIGGVEISAEWQPGTCHILGLGFDKSAHDLEKALQRYRDDRIIRNERILSGLTEAGFPVTVDELQAASEGQAVSRNHIAAIMVHKKYVNSIQEAFDRFLAKGAVAYVERFRYSPLEAVTMIKEAGGVAVLAHPSQLNVSFEDLDRFISGLQDVGLDGVEVFTPYAEDGFIQDVKMLCRKRTLLITGGSDFHGTIKPGHLMGYYRDDTPIPEVCARGIPDR